MKVTVFHDVEEFYEQLYHEIKVAKYQVDLIYLAYVKGSWTSKINKVLIEKAKSGVKVRLMVDPLGQFFEDITKSFSSLAMLNDLKSNGIQVFFFKQKNFLRVHLHTKACIVDQQVLLTGGSNIADHYTSWSDTNFLIKNIHDELITNLFDVYLTPSMAKKYIKNRDKIVFDKQHPSFYINLPQQPDQVKKSILSFINNSKKNLFIETWYFLPDKIIIDSLIAALHRGVNIQIIISQKNRLPIINLLNKKVIYQLRKKGASIYLWKKNYRHKKLYWNEQNQVIFGSVNLDMFSMNKNMEMAVTANDKTIADSLSQDFYQALEEI